MTAIVNTPDQTETLTVIGEELRPLLTNGMGSPLEIFGKAPSVKDYKPYRHERKNTNDKVPNEQRAVLPDPLQ